ncbi:MAG: hypothetical protein HGA75_13355 [Thiobacillus sp.]|nr:hypothetical protein [Thiobacillus sp.]
MTDYLLSVTPTPRRSWINIDKNDIFHPTKPTWPGHKKMTREGHGSQPTVGRLIHLKTVVIPELHEQFQQLVQVAWLIFRASARTLASI